MKQKLAIFDIDGTLYDGTISLSLLNSLLSQNLFSPIAGEQIVAWHKKYKSGEVEKSIAVDKMYELYVEGMTGKQAEVIEKIAATTWESVKSKLYDFAPHLFDLLRSSNYQIILLTGGTIEMATQLSRQLEIDPNHLIAGTPEIIDGVYTGKMLSYLGSAQQKIDALHRRLHELNLEVDWLNSFAFGDDERDEKVLSLVGHPFAINPDVVLTNLAIQNNWTIATKDNVIGLFSANLK